MNNNNKIVHSNILIDEKRERNTPKRISDRLLPLFSPINPWWLFQVTVSETNFFFQDVWLTWIKAP